MHAVDAVFIHCFYRLLFMDCCLYALCMNRFFYEAQCMNTALEQCLGTLFMRIR